MFSRNPFSSHPGTVTLDGREVPVATLSTKGLAVAVDLSLTVGVASLLFYLISLAVPLDSPAASTPIGLAVAGAFAYLVFGRDNLLSPGRRILRLELVRMPGHMPGLLGRRMSVHRDEAPGKAGEPVVKSALVVLFATALSLFALAASLTSTELFDTVRAHAATQPLGGGITGPVTLSTLPRALLVGRSRGYVQVDAETPSGKQTLEFFVRRESGSWRVAFVGLIEPTMWANFSLGASDADVPSPPSRP